MSVQTIRRENGADTSRKKKGNYAIKSTMPSLWHPLFSNTFLFSFVSFLLGKWQQYFFTILDAQKEYPVFLYGERTFKPLKW